MAAEWLAPIQIKHLRRLVSNLGGLHRVMRMRLRATGSNVSLERALELLRQLQRHRVHLPDDQTVIGLSTVSSEQAELFTSLKLPRPSTKNL